MFTPRPGVCGASATEPSDHFLGKWCMKCRRQARRIEHRGLARTAFWDCLNKPFSAFLQARTGHGVQSTSPTIAR